LQEHRRGSQRRDEGGTGSKRIALKKERKAVLYAEYKKPRKRALRTENIQKSKLLKINEELQNFSSWRKIKEHKSLLEIQKKPPHSTNSRDIKS
jgi:hypothetical protein